MAKKLQLNVRVEQDADFRPLLRALARAEQRTIAATVRLLVLEGLQRRALQQEEARAK